MDMLSLFMKILTFLVAFNQFKVKIKLQKNKKLKVVKSYRGDKYYDRCDENGRNQGSFAKYLQDCVIEAQ